VGRISPSSPIGRCLLGHEEGDVVAVRVPSGTRELEVTKLVTIHDEVREEEGGSAAEA
jgi:transcription elongation factor GreA